MKRTLLLGTLLSALVLLTPSAIAATAQSDLVLGGTTVSHVSFSSANNQFGIYDDYPDNQSAAVRYRVGKSTKTYTGWNSGGEGSSKKVTVHAGGLAVKFRACRADRDGAVQFQCAKKWKTVTGSCLKGKWTAVRKRAGACLSYSGQVQHTGGGVYSKWGFRVRGQISAPGKGTNTARLQVRTHTVGNPWSAPKTVVKVGDGKRKTFDKVVSAGGPPFFQQYRVCGKTCGKWTNGDGSVGF